MPANYRPDGVIARNHGRVPPNVGPGNAADLRPV